MFQQQGQDHAACGTTGTKQQDAASGKLKVKIVLEIAHQSGAISVVADNFGTVKAECIDRPGSLGAGAKASREAKGFLLEWYRDIGATCARIGAKLGDCSGKAVDGCQHGFVAHGLPRLRSEQCMDAW